MQGRQKALRCRRSGKPEHVLGSPIYFRSSSKFVIHSLDPTPTSKREIDRMTLFKNSAELDSQAAALIKGLAEGCASQTSCGSFSSVPYDSAWVSMIKKDDHGCKRWRFPECFEYILGNQKPDGGWSSGAVESTVDFILNTMASLLALQVHHLEPLKSRLPSDIEARILRAVTFLQTQFDTWDVGASDHVGFEILVPTLLELLEKQGFHFRLKYQLHLTLLNEKKMTGFRAEMLYKHKQHTVLHSLEGLVGKIDFDRVSHHKVSGSMMGSPSSTAAYLIYSSKWDEKAECYLEGVISNGSGRGSGGVPSAFPTPVFETSWTLSTLLISGFAPENLGVENVRTIGKFLKHSFEDGNGLLGFAQNLLADADDTAKTIISLSLIGWNVSPERLVSEFETASHFKTYSTERNPSFSANCNVLCALLSIRNPTLYLPQILKATAFLCNSWWEGSCRDKWNISSQYPMMLLTQVLMRLLRFSDNGLLEKLPQKTQGQIPVLLCQILNQTIRGQGSDGGWNDSREISAYSVLTLIHLRALPFASSLATEIDAAITSGRSFINASSSTEPDNIWIEKVSYGSSVLCEAYCLSALNAPVETTAWGAAVISMISVPEKAIERFAHFFSDLPILAEEAKWKLRASLVEGYLFLPMLKAISHDIFPDYENSEQKYLEYIPLTWTMTNNMHGNRLSAKFLEEMMIISMLNYQADEFMEAVVAKQSGDDLAAIKAIVRSLCRKPTHKPNGFGNGVVKHGKPETNGTTRIGSDEQVLFNTETLEPTRSVLQRFTSYVLDHPGLSLSSTNDQLNLRRELETFLLSHITHIEDNAQFSRQEISESTVSFLNPRSTYYNWVHTTSASHTSCPYSFAFISGLMSTGPSDCFESSFSKYLAQDLCSHLAVMCRQYNDYGSVRRDRIERNLNSINFPEFHSRRFDDGEYCRASDAELKAALFEVAEFERECLTSTMEKLLRGVPSRVADMLNVFVGVTDLYGQIYVARDIGIASRG